MESETVDGEYIEVAATSDLEKLNGKGLERGDTIILHYTSRQKPATADSRRVSRTVTYRSHWGKQGLGGLSTKDGEQTIEVERTEHYSLRLLSKNNRARRLGLLKGITIPEPATEDDDT